MLMEPIACHGCCCHHADRFVVLTHDFVAMTVLPRSGAERFRPRIGIALALHADEDRGRGMLVRLGIAAVLMLADPEIEAVVSHQRLDAAIAGRAAIVGCEAGGGAV